jgi:hypothetical protein
MRVRVLMALIVMAALIGETSGVLPQKLTAKIVDSQKNFIMFATGQTKKPNGRDKDAEILIADGDDDMGPLGASFPDAAAWEIFANLWIKAMAAQPPAKGGNGLTIGNYQDPVGTFLTVTKYDNGEVTVALVWHDSDTRVFHVQPAGFEVFGSKILEVSKILAD